MVHQFEKIVTWKELVLCHPWNIDYLIQRNHMLLLVLGPDCDTCKEALEVFVSDGLEREA